jgi:capsular polysaccharide export protein
VRSTLVNVNVLPLTPAFWWAALKALFSPPLPEAVTDPIVALDYAKYTVNRTAFLRLFDGTIEWLWRRVATAYLLLFRNRLRNQNASLVVIWGGFQLPITAALTAAREEGIGALFCENGYLPRTIVMDTQGINAGNSLMGKSVEFYRAVAMSGEDEKSLLNTTLVARPLKKGTASAESIVLPEKFVFLPLQVHDDSQILLYSPRFSDMPSVIRFCVEGIAAYNRTTGETLRLVVKEHPSDHGRIDYARIRRACPDAVFTKLMNTQELIEKCAAVVTVNSTVGIEAMLRFKPIITLGKAFYAVPGLATACEGNENFAEALQTALSNPVDRDLTARFLTFLRRDYLVPLDRNSLAGADPKPIVAKILEALG